MVVLVWALERSLVLILASFDVPFFLVLDDDRAAATQQQSRNGFFGCKNA
jgi:hypothetical protein